MRKDLTAPVSGVVFDMLWEVLLNDNAPSSFSPETSFSSSFSTGKSISGLLEGPVTNIHILVIFRCNT